MTELSDDLLVAYVDGQLARDQSRAVKRVLDQDHIAAHRAESLRLAHDRLEWVLESLLDDERSLLLGDIEPPPPSPPPRPSLRDRIAQWGTATLGSAAAVLTLGGLIAGYAIWGGESAAPVSEPEADPVVVGSIPSPEQDPSEMAVIETASVPAIAPIAGQTDPTLPANPVLATWQEEVGRMQALFARESLEVGLEAQGNLDFVHFQLSKAIGAELVIPDLSTDGFKFARAQALRHRGEPFAQLSYLPESGAPVALYAKPDASPQSDISARSIAGMIAVVWSEKGISYVLTGRLEESEMKRLAEVARKQTLDP